MFWSIRRGTQWKFLLWMMSIILLIFWEWIWKREGYTVIVAYDGVQALEVALSQKPDLILLDCMLPKMDGFWRMPEAAPADEHSYFDADREIGRDWQGSWPWTGGGRLYHEAFQRQGSSGKSESPASPADLSWEWHMMWQVKSFVSTISRSIPTGMRSVWAERWSTWHCGEFELVLFFGAEQRTDIFQGGFAGKSVGIRIFWRCPHGWRHGPQDEGEIGTGSAEL